MSYGGLCACLRVRPRYLADSFGKGVGPFVVSLMIAKFQSRCALRASEHFGREASALAL